MISDTLFEAVEEIRRYLKEPVFSTTYTGNLRRQIEKVTAEMEAIRILLDMPPKKVKLNQRQRDVLLHLLEDDEAERYSPLSNIAVALNWTKNDVRLVCRQLARKGLAKRVPFHDDEGYIRGSGYGITPEGKNFLGEDDL